MSSIAPLSAAMANKRKNLKVCQFTMMIVGTSGLGKTSFVNTLFNEQVAPISHVMGDGQGLAESMGGTVLTMAELEKPVPVSFIPYTIEREEFGTKMAMTIIETPGFGDSLYNEAGCDTILKYIETQFDHVLEEESRIKRNPKFQDTRIHVLLYFIAPTGHGLRELDILFMKIVGKRVNVIPVIAKADALTPEELVLFKQRIMEDIIKYNIPIFQFPYEDEDDMDIATENEDLRALLPFAIVSSETESLTGGYMGGKRRGRRYPWGFIEVDNPRHCDFSRLRNVLLNSHLQDLKDITQNVLYENYRTEKLSPDSNDKSVSSVKPTTVTKNVLNNTNSNQGSLSAETSTEDISVMRQKLKSRFGADLATKEDQSLLSNIPDARKSTNTGTAK
jgi:cell division control protein 11